MAFQEFSSLYTPYEAIDMINKIDTATSIENIPLSRAYGRILAENIIASRSLPSCDVAAMDGYAFNSCDSSDTFNVVSTVYAGDRCFKDEFKEGECCKIMTGAPIPHTLDSVLPHEHCLMNGHTVRPLRPLVKGKHICIEGESIKQNTMLLKAGSYLNGGAIGLVASQGIQTLNCYTSMRIAMCATGNEVGNLGQKIAQHHVYNSNIPMLKAFLDSLGFVADDCGVISDDMNILKKNIEILLQEYDCIMTTGGVSCGEKDLLRLALESLDFEIIFHGINIKPGKPILLAKRDKKFFLGLPGTPTGAFAAFCIIGLAFLRHVLGFTSCLPIEIDALLAQSLEASKDKFQMVLGIFENGLFKPLPFSLPSIAIAQSYILLAPCHKTINAQQNIKVYLLPWALCL